MSGVQRLLPSRDREKSKERKPHHLGRHHHHRHHSSSHTHHHHVHHHGSSHTRSESGSELWVPDPSSPADFYGLFYLAEKPFGHSEEFKISNIRQQVIYTKGVAIRDATILWVLRSSIANGDEHAAYRFLIALSDASEGLIANYESSIGIKGAVNRHGVTCYLDATLFAMFCRVDSFEAMLYNTFSDLPRNKLSFLLRLWVNLIRTGQLVTVEVTALIQNALRDCGWAEAADLQQQDASEAFIFITGKLELPLLTLKMDIYHTGKEDASDDHKFVNERLLDVAIPEDPSGQHTEITLEYCLEEYFNNRVEVKRYLERRSTLASVKNEYGSTPSKSSPIHVEVAEIHSPSLSGPTLPSYKGRAQSIIQERYIPAGDEDAFPSKLTSVDTHTTTYSRTDSIRKEVVMPAWQFFSLIPWYTDNAPSNDAQVAAHFSSKRPMLGMCLKRYAFRNGRPVRLNTYVDIPVEIGLPHFIQDDQMSDDGALFGNFKLSLQAVVCHRGYSVNSGHYVALVRSNPNSEEMPLWVRFDDLAPTRVLPIDIYAALREETPYLLFYQILPIDGDPGAIMTGLDSRSKSDTSLPMYQPPPIDPDFSLLSSDQRPRFEVAPATLHVVPPTPPPPPPPSAPLLSDDDDPFRDPVGSRRQSAISIIDPSADTPPLSSSSLTPSRNLSDPSVFVDRSRVAAAASSGFGRTLSKLKRRSRGPDRDRDRDRDAGPDPDRDRDRDRDPDSGLNHHQKTNIQLQIQNQNQNQNQKPDAMLSHTLPHLQHHLHLHHHIAVGEGNNNHAHINTSTTATATATATATGPGVRVAEIPSHSNSFPIDPLVNANNTSTESKSAYQESRTMAAAAFQGGYPFQQPPRAKAANRLSKHGRDKTRRPDRECVVM